VTETLSMDVSLLTTRFDDWLTAFNGGDHHIAKLSHQDNVIVAMRTRVDFRRKSQVRRLSFSIFIPLQ
jgi:hypothetical protein